jgi:hypothetical protein
MRFFRWRILVVEMVCGPDITQATQRTSHVMMVARGKQATSALAKTSDTRTIGGGQAVSRVDREEPQLIVDTLIERAQDGIIASRLRLAIANGEMKWHLTAVVFNIA